MAAAAGLLRPHPYLTPLFQNSTTTASSRDTRSSESDSGASSADPEDDARSAFSYTKPSDYAHKLPSPASDSEYFDRRKFISALVNAPPSVSPASLPSISPGGIPRWLSPFQGLADPAAWRELWARGLPSTAAPAPDQVEPIDLSVKTQLAATPPPSEDSDQELCIDVGIDEPVNKALPLDLTLGRPTTIN